MKKMMFLIVAIVTATSIYAQSPIGTWKTIDDETNEAKSYVTIYEQDGRLFGDVDRLLKSSPDRLCDKCPGERKDQPVLHMTILENLEMEDGFWQGGRILDPEKGKWYACKCWLKDGDPNILVVRGSIGPFYRTQYWHRVD